MRKRLLTTIEVAEELGIARQTVVRMTNRGELKCTKSGNRRYYDRNDIIKFEPDRLEKVISELIEIKTLQKEILKLLVPNERKV